MNKPVRILVVDDEKSIRESLKLILEYEGYFVDTAENGKDAILKSYTNVYNFALIDFRLPDMYGTEVLVRIRKTVPKTIKFIVSGFPSAQIAVNKVENECDRFFTKPVDFESLLTAIKFYLEKQTDQKLCSEENVTVFMDSEIREIETH